ncbi:MAG TPA: phosphoglucosamine mutase [Gemmatimonadota bacterium]
MSVSGVRGRVGGGLVPELMVRLAAAHGARLQARSSTRGARERVVVVGRDSRTSGPMLRDAAVAGLLSVGCDVLDLGLCPTPTALLAVRTLGAAGGLIVTASHNPVEWNGAKLVSGRGLFLTPAESRETLDLFLAGGATQAGWDGLGRAREERGALAAHVRRILAAPEVDVARVRERGFRVVLDACHGVGALLLEPLLQELGCGVETLYGEPTGRFPRAPEPVPQALGELAGRVRATGADLGLAVDPDGDRLALVAEDGVALAEDLTLALAVARVLPLHAGPVVTNLSTSRAVDDAAARAASGPVVRVPVGEIHVAERMLSLGSPIGGEGNGGVIYPAVHPTRDAGSAAALVLSHLAATGSTLSEAAAALPRYAIVKESVPLSAAGVGFEAARVASLFPGAPLPDLEDGVRLEWPEERAWVHVRPSATEPIVRIIAEAPTAEAARRLVDRARAAFDPPRTSPEARAARGPA